MNQDLIIGTAINYQINDLKNFINSFRHFNSDAKVILLTGSINDETNDYLLKNNIDFFPISNINTSWSKLVNKRFLIYLSILKSSFFKFNNIFVTDVRDVLFQSNPFQSLPTDYLYFALEDESILMREIFNSSGQADLFGITRFCEPDIIEFMGNFPVICCGTILGSSNKMISLLELYQKLYFHFKNHVNFDESNQCADQGIINLIARLPMLSSQINGTILNSGNLIATIGLSVKANPNSLKVENGKIFVNGNLPAIVHQYDRFSDEIVKSILINSYF